MNRHTLQTHSQSDQDAVLTKALLNLEKRYRLTGRDMKQILGVSEASMTRLRQHTKTISVDSKEGELALLLIRLYRNLNALVGDDPAKARAWLTSHNHYFDNTPLTRIKRVDGLVEVVSYLDMMRGKL